MTSAAVYVRVSTSRQAERDLSMPDQIAQCRAFCERKGWEVVEVFSEPGASALDEDRPVFQEMIFKAKRADKPFDYVVVHSLSRFSRDTLHSELYIRELRKAGVNLVSVTQDVGEDGSGEFIRKMLNVFDEHQSRETAKHVHRAMLENARQGFWNGAVPPFGYRTMVTERRGNKDKKVLVIEETEAAVIRQIFAMASGVSGRPMGVKAIASYLNDRGVRRRGRKFSTGSIYETLTSTTYHGRHVFNRRDSRSSKLRPPSQWVTMDVPALVDEATFNAVQGLLQSRRPSRTPPRVANGPTLLAGIIRCGYCGSAMIQNTGKGGHYRYYCCSRKLKEGTTSCKGIRMRMDRLDEIVIGEVTKRVLEPRHLTDLLDGYIRSTVSREDEAKLAITRLRQSHKEAEAAISRLLDLVERGLMEADDTGLKERLVGLRLQRDELARELAERQHRLATGAPKITPEKVEQLGMLLKERLEQGPAEFRQAYARLLMEEVNVRHDEIRISGSKAILARCASEGSGESTPAVLSFVREWRPGRDSNP